MDWTPQKCSATSSQTGQPCKRWAIRGGTVCASHGGRAPAVKAAAARRIEVARASASATTFGLPVEIDPHAALLGEVHRAAGVVAWLTLQVQRLSSTEVTWGETRKVDQDGGPGGGFRSVEEAAAVNLWVKLLGEWSDRLVRVSKAAIDAGVSERLVRLEERKGELIAQLLADVIDDPVVGLTDEQKQRARQAAADRLRALPTG